MNISNSKAKTYRRCPNQYRYKYVMKLSPKAKKVHLEKGTWMHALLQAYYTGGKKAWQRKHKELTRDFNNLMDEYREELGDLPRECLKLMFSYLRHYPHDAEQYRTVDAELDEFITLPNGLRLEIIIDLILEDLEGGLWMWDHKFRAKLGDADDMLLDPQLTLYFWGLEHMGYTPLRGATYNEVRTKLPTVPKVLRNGQLEQRSNVDTDVYTYMKAIKDNGLDPSYYREQLQLIAQREPERFYRRTPIPKDQVVIKTMMRELVQTAQEIQVAEQKNRYPRTFDTSCKFQCPYKNMCIAELHGADISSIIKTDFETSHRDQLR